ncbi:hypothetical protein D020_0603B, partial [Vibrio parahaemolyticus SBR10290]
AIALVGINSVPLTIAITHHCTNHPFLNHSIMIKAIGNSS